MASQKNITNYYLTQAGGGHFYAGAPYQKGYGIGSWLGGLFRTILPVLKSGAAAVGKEAARAGSHVLADVATGQNFRESVGRHVEQSGKNLATKAKRKIENAMEGSGAIKRRKTAPKPHSAVKAQRRNTSNDIYS